MNESARAATDEAWGTVQHLRRRDGQAVAALLVWTAVILLAMWLEVTMPWRYAFSGVYLGITVWMLVAAYRLGRAEKVYNARLAREMRLLPVDPTLPHWCGWPIDEAVWTSHEGECP